MIMMMFFNKLEHFLRIDPNAPKSHLMRARAVYMMGLAFIAAQLINLAAMYYSYGGFTFDHMISLIACGLVVVTIISMRHSKNFPVYALVYSVLIVAGTMSSALNQNTGINSALIPFFVLGVIVNGFICGWRATMAFGFFTIAALWFLWWVSSNYSYTPIFDVEHFTDRNFQRAVQASLATLLITLVGAFFSKNMHEAFEELETGIAEAQDSDRAKTDFLATMSHELFTPMNGIIGVNEVLEETALDEEQRELTAIIRDSGRDLQTIIGNVLLFSQLEAGRVTFDNSPFNISVSLRDVIRVYAQQAKAKGLIFKAQMSSSVPTVLIGDKVRTGQILSALLDNAVKFTDKGAVELDVQSRVKPDGRIVLLMTITDTGIGIAEDYKARIFERFTQEDGSIKRRHGGTGLGLTIARGLVDIMGGQFTVQSEVGIGSSFKVTLTFDTADSVSESWKQAAE